MKEWGLKQSQNKGQFQPILKVEEVKRDTVVKPAQNTQWGLWKEEGESSKPFEELPQRLVEDQMLDLNLSLVKVSSHPQEEYLWKSSVAFDLNSLPQEDEPYPDEHLLFNLSAGGNPQTYPSLATSQTLDLSTEPALSQVNQLELWQGRRGDSGSATPRGELAFGNTVPIPSEIGDLSQHIVIHGDFLPHKE